MLCSKIKDKKVIELLFRIIGHPVPGNRPGKGLPIGNLTSQLFANIYLDKLDHFVKEDLKVKAYTRYMDDSVFFAMDKNILQELLYEINSFIRNKLLLTFNFKEIIIAPVTQGIPFLGSCIFPGVIRLKRKNFVRFLRMYKNRVNDYSCGIINQDFFNRSTGSMIAHISHANTYQLRKSIFY